ncbi:hypothetical protein K7432_011728 [Basidiobolus ranarum]|uniref:Polysaccharide lyase 14 domain-containing protein n=1 Tax=Basidiobolus ranarum TaxID=34480 RepID=A0ABR2WLY2_9FUNG
MNNFESSFLSNLSTSHFWGQQNRHFVVSASSSGINTLMQVVYPKGSRNPSGPVSGGCGFDLVPTNTVIKSNAILSFQYQVYFPPDFNFNLGGKLPGLFGGHANCTGGDKATNCFDARIMWRRNGQGEAYVYLPRQAQVPNFCTTPPVTTCNPVYGISIGRGSFKFLKNQWNTIRMLLKANSSPTSQDGWLRVDWNNQIAINMKNLAWRTQDNVTGTGVDFSTFYGGSSDPFNAPETTFALFKGARFDIFQ